MFHTFAHHLRLVQTILVKPGEHFSVILLDPTMITLTSYHNGMRYNANTKSGQYKHPTNQNVKHSQNVITIKHPYILTPKK